VHLNEMYSGLGTHVKSSHASGVTKEQNGHMYASLFKISHIFFFLGEVNNSGFHILAGFVVTTGSRL
jgi:hypothetical protein